MKSCRGAYIYSVYFLVQGKYRFKITYRTQDTYSCPKKTCRKIERISCNCFFFYQQQLGKEFEMTEKEGVVKELIHIDEEWKQIKEVLVEAAV